MTRKELINYYEDLKEGIWAKSHSKSTNAGFRQVLKRVDTINRELQRLYREKE